MSHQIEQMFSVKETPWHGLGHIIQEAPTSEEAIRLAGLDWSVSKRPAQMTNPDGSTSKIEGYNAITRDDTGQVFNVLTDKYEPLQNVKAFNFFDQFVEKGLARYETAGSLSEDWRLVRPTQSVPGNAPRRRWLCDLRE